MSEGDGSAAGRGSASYPRSTRSMRSITGCSATPVPAGLTARSEATPPITADFKLSPTLVLRSAPFPRSPRHAFAPSVRRICLARRPGITRLLAAARLDSPKLTTHLQLAEERDAAVRRVGGVHSSLRSQPGGTRGSAAHPRLVRTPASARAPVLAACR